MCVLYMLCNIKIATQKAELKIKNQFCLSSKLCMQKIKGQSYPSLLSSLRHSLLLCRVAFSASHQTIAAVIKLCHNKYIVVAMSRWQIRDSDVKIN